MREINLLPKPKQQELYYEAILHVLYQIISISVISFALVFLAQFGTGIILKGQLWTIQNRIEVLKTQVNKNENSTTRQQIVSINNRIADYKNLAGATPKWSKVLKAFAVLPPPEVKINSLNIDLNKKLINITGTSPTREKVIETYYNILNDSKEFYNIDYPLENVAKPKDINFHFTFNVKDDLLK